MYGRVIMNSWLEIAEYNCTDDALNDLYQVLPILKEKLPFAESLVTEELACSLAEWLKEAA